MRWVYGDDDPMYAWASFSMKFSCGQRLAVGKTPPPRDSLCGFALGFHEEARTSRPPTASGKMLNTLNITKFLRRGSIFRTGGFSRAQHLLRSFALASGPCPAGIDVNLDLMKPEGPAKSKSGIKIKGARCSKRDRTAKDAEAFATDFSLQCRTGRFARPPVSGAW